MTDVMSVAKGIQTTKNAYKRQNALDDIIEEYKALKRQGFRVPQDI